jgi:hypothetical protein
MLVALFFAPIAWLSEMAIAPSLSVHSCMAGGGAPLLRTVPWALVMILAASFACLLLATLGTAGAWTNVRRTARMSWRSGAGRKGTRAESDWFLSRIGLISSAMFTFGLVVMEIGSVIISPCAFW